MRVINEPTAHHRLSARGGERGGHAVGTGAKLWVLMQVCRGSEQRGGKGRCPHHPPHPQASEPVLARPGLRYSVSAQPGSMYPSWDAIVCARDLRSRGCSTGLEVRVLLANANVLTPGPGSPKGSSLPLCRVSIIHNQAPAAQYLRPPTTPQAIG